MANQLGKRYQCESCGTEILCIKAASGEVHCCGAAMQVMQPKVLPSAD
ncbi:MAG: desulforedoxin [Dehalococcoidia bacterium]